LVHLDQVLALAFHARRSPCRRAALWRFASAWPRSGSLALSGGAIPATSALRVLSPSVEPELAPSSKTTSALHPAAVGSLLQILIARIRKENANTAVRATDPCEELPMQAWRVGNAYPSPDGQRSRSSICWRCFSKARRLSSSAWSIDSASSAAGQCQARA